MENMAEELNPVPSSILIDFFRNTVEKLERYACGNEYCNETGEAQAADSLAVLRLRLIQVQLETLHHAVEDYNSRSQGSVISTESVQRALRQVGETKRDGEDCNDNDKCLYESMQRMNEAARLAFVRSVINAFQEDLEERKLFGKRQEDDDDDPSINSTISRHEILEYFGLVIVALSMREVQQYLTYGGQIDFSGNSSSCQQQARDEQLSTPETRLLLLKGLFLRAVIGHFRTENPTVFVLREAKRLLLPDSTSSSTNSSNDDQVRSTNDEEFLRVFENYLSAVRVAKENAISSWNVSHLDRDGVTRVVSVTYSEISPMDAGEGTSAMSSPPQPSIMDEHRESEQRQNLSMARKVSQIQQALLDQLLGMDEDDRAFTLKEAKETHDNFLKEALSIPAVPQRILFMQSIDEESQKKLIIHKLWESKLAK